MSNRAQRRASGRITSKLPRPSPAVGSTPTMSVFTEDGAVIIHIGFGDIWINQIRMSVADAENHAKELADICRGMRSGIVVADRPSGLIVPGGNE